MNIYSYYVYAYLNEDANIKRANQGKNIGRVLSEETKAKIRESNKATWAKKLLSKDGR